MAFFEVLVQRNVGSFRYTRTGKNAAAMRICLYCISGLFPTTSLNGNVSPPFCVKLAEVVNI